MKDQMGREVEVPTQVRRIISLVPSQTELLNYLGLDDQIVGITKFCIHPEHIFRTKTRVGGTKQLRMEQIAALQPDLIIGNKEENEQGQIEVLMSKYPVWMSDIKSLADAYQMMEMLGSALNRRKETQDLLLNLQNRFSNLDEVISDQPIKRVAYFIWRNPWMVAGSDTFIDSMLEAGGFVNVFKEQTRYPQIQLRDLTDLNLDGILLSSEPYPFKEQHIKELADVCGSKVELVDGELFSWYGPRLLGSADELIRVHGLL